LNVPKTSFPFLSENIVGGLSGLVVSTPHCRMHGLIHAAASFCAFTRKSLQYADLGMGCKLTVVSRLTQPFAFRGVIK